MNEQARSLRPARVVFGAALLAVLTAATWWVWLGRDTTYQVDPDTGLASGPYEVPQVIGCVVTLIVLGGVAAWLMPSVVVVAVMTVSFTAAWSWHASSRDSTGLWGVGALGVLFGMTMGSTVIALIAAGLRDSWARRRLTGRR